MPQPGGKKTQEIREARRKQGFQALMGEKLGKERLSTSKARSGKEQPASLRSHCLKRGTAGEQRSSI